MKTLFKNNYGTTAVEFALVGLPVFLFIFGIMQTGWIMWTDNLLHVSVNAAARCGAVKSTTPPCNSTNMVAAATTVFAPLSGAVFVSNATCSANGASGLIGTKQVSILFVVNLTLTAKSCYPNLS
jgi:Flp pilus assembly protein TadG